MEYFVNIALPVPIDKLFSYKVDWDGDINDLIGMRVLVQFGKRMMTGIVTEVNAAPSSSLKIKKIDEVLDKFPSFTGDMLELTKWVAEYYMCPWGLVLKAALPAGMSPKTLIKVSLAKNLDEKEIDLLSGRSERRRMLLNYLLKSDAPVSLAYLKRKLKISYIGDYLETLAENGIIRIETDISKTVSVKKQKGVVLTPDYFENETKLRTLLDELDKNKYKHSLLLSKVFLSQSKNIVPKLSSLLKEVNISRSVVNTFVKKGILEIVDIEVDRSVGNEESLSVRDESKLTLSDEQQHCLEQIKRTIANGETKPILIKGVTGSGKTLIYMHIIAEMLEKGKNILLLVPEISLTPQLIDRFRNTFGDNIVALHSRMSDGERFDAWRLIRLGEKQIIIGARSAVFAPVRNLGLIIVDEEHDHSYKQDSPVPRYNGRDTAIMRANFAGIPVILGSATPSLESMYNAEIGKYKLLQINRRADGAVLPEISLVDKIEAKKSGQMNGAISKYLLDEIKERLKNKEGIILFQNRRGFASFLECPDCGYVPMCKNCDVALTYHKSKNQLRCHYCGYSTHSFNACPACGYAGLKELGYGTQRIEDELEQLLHEEGFAPVIQRVDLDSTSRKGALRKIFTGFISGEIDILIGTQMVSKGLDFERVTLVGVIDADLQMFLPDFRATERTFQLLTQVAGRSGRTSAKPGKVVIQTAHPRHLALRAVFASSYDMFYKEELENRRKAVYPPFVRFVVIEFSGKDEATVEAKANDFYKLIPASDSFEMLGVTLPLIPKLQNRYRRMIIIKSDKQKDKSGKTLRRSLAAALQQYNVKHSSSSVFLKIDIDAFSTF